MVNQPLCRLVDETGHAVRPFPHGLVDLLQNLLQLRYIALGISALHQPPCRRFHASPGVHSAIGDLPLQPHQLLEVVNRVPQLRILLLQNLVHLHRIRVTVRIEGAFPKLSFRSRVMSVVFQYILWKNIREIIFDIVQQFGYTDSRTGKEAAVMP